MSEPSIRRYQESVTVVAPAEALYDMVSDITRTGEWSPVCTSCWWDEEAQAGQVGAWFNGHNELPDRTWETRSEVVVAERGREFAWVVGGSFVRWGFTLVPAGLGAWVGNNIHDHLWRKKLRIRLPGSGCPNFWDFGPSWWSASSDSPVGLALRTHAPRSAGVGWANCLDRPGVGTAHRRQQHLGDVDDLDALVGAGLRLVLGQPVGEHDPTEGAADRDTVCAGGQGFLGAVGVDPRAEVLLHPHPRAAGATAEGLLTLSRHLAQLDSGQCADQLARRGIDTVVPAEVTGVVVRDGCRGRGHVGRIGLVGAG